jgi:hypothetical protein
MLNYQRVTLKVSAGELKKTCTAKYSNTKVSIQDFPSMLRGTG